ncbi:MAG: hypothetical protein KDC54_10335, partial [Lewinella sp.]|nr:hypothetical protein [Lewinella sp.]
MRPIFRRMLGFCSLLLPLLLPGQNLLQDAQELATNLAILQRQQAPPDQREQALSQTLAILAYYGTDPSGIDPRPATPEAIQALYQRNGKLSAYVQQLGPALPQVNPLDLQPYLQAFDTSRQARQVLDLLYNSDYRTPADYLSMVKTLQDYQEPPVSGIQALQATATSAPSQASTSLL